MKTILKWLLLAALALPLVPYVMEYFFPYQYQKVLINTGKARK